MENCGSESEQDIDLASLAPQRCTKDVQEFKKFQGSKDLKTKNIYCTALYSIYVGGPSFAIAQRQGTLVLVFFGEKRVIGLQSVMGVGTEVSRTGGRLLEVLLELTH